MNIKIHSSELNRIMKTLGRCIDGRHQSFSNIKVIYDNNLLTLRGTNGQFSAVMSTPLLGGDGETFCVDGELFGKVCAMSKGEVEINTDGHNCVMKGNGRTRLPIVKANIPAYPKMDGNVKTTVIRAEAFRKGYNGVAYAVSNDQGQARIVLTGVNTEIGTDMIRMVSLDGFRMAMEESVCSGEEMKMVIPGAFMKLIADSTVDGEEITVRTDGTKVQAETDGMAISCPLLSGEFPDYRRLLPESFKTEAMVNAEQLRTALKCGSVICSSSNLVKLFIGGDAMVVSGNSEEADFDAEIGCKVQGDGLKIAFNQKYLSDTIASIGGDEIVMKFNGPSQPCVVTGKEPDGVRLILPVRVMG